MEEGANQINLCIKTIPVVIASTYHHCVFIIVLLTLDSEIIMLAISADINFVFLINSFIQLTACTTTFIQLFIEVIICC